jgi:hypothetical protein
MDALSRKNTMAMSVEAPDPDGDPARVVERLVHPGEISRESLRHLIELAQAGKWRLIHWERYGQPPITDRVRGTFEVPMDQAGKVVEGVFATPGMRSRIRDVFPKGIPVIDKVSVEFEALPGFRR